MGITPPWQGYSWRVWFVSVVFVSMSNPITPASHPPDSPSSPPISGPSSPHPAAIQHNPSDGPATEAGLLTSYKPPDPKNSLSQEGCDGVLQNKSRSIMLKSGQRLRVGFYALLSFIHWHYWTRNWYITYKNLKIIKHVWNFIPNKEVLYL